MLLFVSFYISLVSLTARVSKLDALQEVGVDWVDFKLVNLFLGGLRAALSQFSCDLGMSADDRACEAYSPVYVRGCKLSALGKQLQQLKFASH